MKDRFYLVSLRDTVGSNTAFHSHHGRGYSTDQRNARVYTREEAQRAWNTGREFDLPVDADAVDRHLVFHVDHQFVPGKTILSESATKYVGFVNGQWDGNDLFWLADAGTTTDFSLARVFDSPQADRPDVVWLPHHIPDAAKRPTFSVERIDRRKMTQGAGLLMPAWLKRQNRRQSMGLTRWNCPGCGRISWQQNPYDFDGCRFCI